MLVGLPVFWIQDVTSLNIKLSKRLIKRIWGTDAVTDAEWGVPRGTLLMANYNA
ncbi:hypothetical protein J6590_103837 [Homalodisca vitripennis]|nr:hypothetical protein J6590_103837 [Homalodisca vitripennis]